MKVRVKHYNLQDLIQKRNYNAVDKLSNWNTVTRLQPIQVPSAQAHTIRIQLRLHVADSNWTIE